MSTPLPVPAADDPRLPRAVARALASCRVPRDWAPTVTDLATGRLSPSTLRCCGSGCRPCVQDIQRAAVQTRALLARSEEPESVSGLRLRARGRALLQRVLGGGG